MSNAQVAVSREELLNAWNAAITAWDRARNANWHANKNAEVHAATRACDVARRAYYASFDNA